MNTAKRLSVYQRGVALPPGTVALTPAQARRVKKKARAEAARARGITPVHSTLTSPAEAGR